MVSVVSFYYNDPSSILTESTIVFLQNLTKKTKISKKCKGDGPFLESWTILLITFLFLGRSRCPSNQERGSNDQAYEAGKWPQHPRLWQTQKSR